MSVKLCIPEKVLDQHVVFLGKTGSGKSSAMRHVVEHLLAHNKRVCITDPKGDWWGLKSSADGKGPGLPVIMFGDFKEPKAADVPINQQSGKHIAELVSTGNRPCVIGFRGWSTHHMQMFWIDFAATLFAKNAGELYIVGDEFHNFAPKGKVLSPQAGESLHWSNRLLSEGRGLGLVCLLASQRPQKVHNDTLTSCETLVAMRVIHKADRDAVKDWIDGAGDPKLGSEVLNSLASMPRGEAYVWSPEIEFGPKRIAFPMFETFDSFAPPQLQKRVSTRGWADVDLAAVKEKLATVIEEHRAKDPAELQKQLAQLRRENQQLKAAKPAPAPASPAPAAKTKTVEKFVLKDGQLDRADSLIGKVMALHAKSAELLGTLKTTADEISAAIHKTREPAPVMPARPAPAAAPRPPFVPRVAPQRAAPRHETNGDTAPGDFQPSRPQQRVLDAIAWFNSIGVDAPSRAAVGFVARINPTGGHFRNTVGPLSTHGLIEAVGDDGVRLSDAGAALATAPAGPPTLDAYHAAIRSVLNSGASQRVFDAIIGGGGADLTAEEIGEVSAIDPGGGHFRNSIGPLGTLGLIQRRGNVVHPTDLLFPTSLVNA
jgi:hypothetical protein